MSEQLCAATTKSGNPCKGKPINDTPFCFAHQPKKKDEPEAKTLKIEAALCGHINRHSHGADGKLDNLKCTKPLGHSGDHGAFHFEKKYGHSYPDDYNPRLLITPVIEEGEVWVEWTDMAGIPADEIKPDLSTIDMSKQPFQEKDIGLR